MDRENADRYEVIKMVDPETGFIFHEEHLKNGKLHREDGPARIIRIVYEGEGDAYGQIEEWFLDGVFSRLDGGPAKIHKNMPHDVVTERFYFSDGRPVSAPRPELDI